MLNSDDLNSNNESEKMGPGLRREVHLVEYNFRAPLSSDSSSGRIQAALMPAATLGYLLYCTGAYLPS